MVSLETIALAVGSAKLRYIILLNELYDELQKGCCGDQQSVRCLLGLITALEMDIKDGVNEQTTQDIYKKLLEELSGYNDDYIADPLVVLPNIEVGLVAVNWGQIGGNIYNQTDLINLISNLTPDELTFVNGLRETNGVVSLGLDVTTIGTTNKGILTTPLLLVLGDLATTGNFSALQIVDNTAKLVSYSGQGDDVQIGSELSALENGDVNIGSNRDGLSTSDQRLYFEISGDGTPVMVFRDDLNQSGPEDYEDYSATKRPLSYVTKKMLGESTGLSGVLSIADTDIRTASNPTGTNILRFAHGLNATPTNWQLNGTNPISQAALSASTQTADNTYVTITPDFTNGDGSPINIQWTVKL